MSRQRKIKGESQTKADRKSGPGIEAVREVKLPEIATEYLPGGSPVHYIKTPYAPVVQLEIAVDAGRLKERAPLVSRASAALLKDGTLRYSREEISSIADRTGGTINIQAGLEYASIQIYCLEEQVDILLDLARDMLLFPLYRPEDLRKYVRKRKSRLKRDLTVNEVLGYRKLTEMIFGPTHPYGYNSTAELYDALEDTQLSHFHREHYRTGNMQVFLCCRNPGHILRKLEGIWSGLEGGRSEDRQFELHPSRATFAEVAAVKKGQASIKMGLGMFPRKHPDFAGIYFLNTLLGGFFGSRLIHLIRESEGLAYSVFSSVETFRTSGFFVVGCETSSYRATRVIDLVLSELQRLKTEQVTEDEILLVKNYLFGLFTSMLDGPLNTMELLKGLITEGAGVPSFYRMMDEFKDMDAGRISALAEQYFKVEEMKTVLVR